MKAASGIARRTGLGKARGYEDSCPQLLACRCRSLATRLCFRAAVEEERVGLW